MYRSFGSLFCSLGARCTDTQAMAIIMHWSDGETTSIFFLGPWTSKKTEEVIDLSKPEIQDAEMIDDED